MTTALPAGLDSFTDPLATDATNSVTVPHASQHTTLNDAVKQLELMLVGGVWINAKGKGCKGDNSTDDRANLAATDTAASGGVSYLPPGTYRCATSLTFSNPVWFAPGAQINPDSGQTVTFNAPITAPVRQIFGGAGTVAFGVGAIREGYAEWWGAKGDGSTDCTTALQAALTAAVPLVRGLAGTYLHGLLSGQSNQTIEGAGRDATVLKAKTGLAAGSLLNFAGKSGVRLRHLTLDGGNGINPNSGLQTNLVALLDCTGSGSDVLAEGVTFQNGNYYGFLATGCSDHRSVNCDFLNMANAGVVNFVASGAARPKRVKVIGCTFRNVSSTANIPAAVNIGRCDDVVGMGNTFDSCDSGFVSEHCTRVAYGAMEAHSCGEGFRVSVADTNVGGDTLDYQATIDGCVSVGATDATRAGLTLFGQGIAVNGGRYAGGAGEGVNIATGWSAVNHNPWTIKNVTVQGAVCTGNTLDGIAVVSTAQSTGAGVISDVILQGNVCTGNTRDGLYLGENAAGDIVNLTVANNDLTGNTGGTIGGSYPGTLWSRQSCRFRNNQGVASNSFFTQPTVPASGTPLTNPFGFDAAVTVSGGTVTAVAVNGSNTGITAGTVVVPAQNGTIQLTYSAAPSWYWVPLGQ